MQATQQQPRNSLFIPTLLIGLGFLLLFSNLGYIEMVQWMSLVQLWPLLLIALGLDLMLGRRASWVGMLLALLLLLTMVALVWVVIPAWDSSVNAGDIQTISQPRQDAERAQITINAGVSQLQIAANEPRTPLIEGTINPLKGEEIRTDFHVQNGVAHYLIQSEGNNLSVPFWNFGRDSHWQLKLNPETPLELTISTGVGQAEVDLRALQLEKLMIDTGVGQTTLFLPEKGRMTVQVRGGVGSVEIMIPTSLAARIEANAGLGDVNVDPAFPKHGESYQSANYNRADDRVELSVEGGVGAVTVEQVP